MLKLRNAVLTALLAFCLAMPFVSCSFNDGATGDVSDKVTVQSDNNQNGGNENPSGGDNGGNGHEHPSGGDSGDVEVTEYTVKYQGEVLDIISAEEFSAYSGLLTEGTDYTISGTVITLTDSGFEKVMAYMPGEGEDGGDSGTEYPGTDYPGTDYPGTDEPDYGNETEYTVEYQGHEVSIIYESELSDFETLLTEGTDYTISGNVITLTESGFNKLNKLSAAGSGAGE